MKLVVIGGGAAGFFAALAAKAHNPSAEVVIVERTSKLLSKVRISGGGRCNVTHSCFDPRLLVRHYPRGNRELLGPFYQFQPEDTIAWFRERGVGLKTEADGRMFPTTDSSATIIDCLIGEAEKLGVRVLTRQKNTAITKVEGGFCVGDVQCDRVLLATGSSPQGHLAAESLGHTIQKPVPSLFTFNVPSSDLLDLAGVSVPNARLTLEGIPFEQSGPLLVTHWGFSGPAALKLSAWAARELYEKDYRVTLIVDWLPEFSEEELVQQLKQEKGSSTLAALRTFPLPKKLWRRFVGDSDLKLAQTGKKQLQQLFRRLKQDRYCVEGKTTNKDEFVTCGGVTLSEVNFKTLESKLCEGLFFAGEVLDIDGVTGGFNFQNSWTTGWLAGQAAVL